MKIKRVNAGPKFMEQIVTYGQSIKIMKKYEIWKSMTNVN